jgi:L1 cell adhesion molecule like protein
MRNSLEDTQLKDKFEEADKQAIEDAVKEALDWLEKNQLAEKEEFDAKQKEVEAIANPIMMKVYQAGGAGAGGMPDMGGAAPDMGDAAGPGVEEVD